MYTRCKMCGVKLYQSLVWFNGMATAFHNPCFDCCEKYDIA